MSYNTSTWPPTANMVPMGPAATAASPFLASASSWGPQQPIASQGALRSWEMGQPGLVAGAGGLPAEAGAPMASMGGGGGGGSIMDSFLQQRDANGATSGGYGAVGLGAAQGLFNAFLGMKQYGLMKDQLNASKQQFGLNYDAQRQTTNASLEDRQRARVASGGAGAYQSVGDYMGAHSIGARP